MFLSTFATWGDFLAGLLQAVDLVETADVAIIPGEVGLQERPHQLDGDILPDHPASQAEDVGVVVFHSLVSRVVVMGQRGAYPGHLVGGDGRAGSGTAHDDAPFRLPVPHRLSHGCGVVRIVHRVGRVGSEVDEVVFLAQSPGEVLLQRISGVVGADGNSRGILLSRQDSSLHASDLVSFRSRVTEVAVRPRIGSADRIVPMAQLQLRPMTAGEILEAAFSVYRKRWGTLMAIAGVLILPYAVLYPLLAESPPSLSINSTAEELQAVLWAMAPWLVIRLLIISIILAAVSRTVVETYVGMESSWRKQAATAINRMIALAAVSVMFWAAVMAGSALFVVPGVFLLVALSACLPVLMVEGVGPVSALSRSWVITSGRRWSVLGVLLVSSVVVVIAEVAGGFLLSTVLVPLQGDFGLWLASELAWLATQPFLGAVLGVMYLDLRVRKEGLDSGFLSLQLSATAFDQ